MSIMVIAACGVDSLRTSGGRYAIRHFPEPQTLAKLCCGESRLGAHFVGSHRKIAKDGQMQQGE